MGESLAGITQHAVLYPHVLPDEYGGRDRLSPDFYEESETDPGAEELPARIFVALFDYDPLTMSPNPDAAEEELPFKEGQIIKVRGAGVLWAVLRPGVVLAKGLRILTVGNKVREKSADLLQETTCSENTAGHRGPLGH